MDLSIIIVSWNVRDRLRECLRSIFDTTRGCPLSFEVFVVDNASQDGSVEMVRAEFPQVQVIANEENLGFAKANNQAMKCKMRNPKPEQVRFGAGAKCGIEEPEFFLLLNPDMRVLPGTLEGIVAFMRELRNARVGIVGCHLVNEQGETVPHVRRFPTLSDQLAIALKLSHLKRARHISSPAGAGICHIFTAPIDRYLVTDFDYSREARVDSIRGSFFCIRRKLIEQIGLLDERFFIWFEEVDFCMRARQVGWQVAYTPSVQCVDYVGQSFKQVRLYPKQRMFIESMLKYFRKHRPMWEWAMLACLRPIVLTGAWLHDRVVDAQRRSRRRPRGHARSAQRASLAPNARSLSASGGTVPASLALCSARATPAPRCASDHPSKLIVQLVSWNGAKYIPHLFRSLREQTLQDWDLIVIDNCSTDGTVAVIERALEELSQFRTKLRKEFRCQFVQNRENRGFAGGHNQGFEMSNVPPGRSPALWAGGKCQMSNVGAQAPQYVQLLNQDTILASEYLERLVAFMDEHPQCGAAQGALLRWDFPRVSDPDGGRTEVVDTLGLRVLRSRRVVEWMTGMEMSNVPPGRSPALWAGGKCQMSNVSVEVFGVSGALPMYRIAALHDVALRKSEVRSQKSEVSEFEIFDEDFFSYKEDVDLAFRLQSAGWTAHVIPDAQAWHDRTAAGPRELSDAAALGLRRTKSPLVRYHSYKNHLFVLIKNELPANFARDWPWIVGYEFKKLAYLLLREPETVRALRKIWRQLPTMSAKRRAIMAKWRVEPEEVRRWFR